MSGSVIMISEYIFYALGYSSNYSTLLQKADQCEIVQPEKAKCPGKVEFDVSSNNNPPNPISMHEEWKPPIIMVPTNNA